MKIGIIDLQGSVKEHYHSIAELVGKENVFKVKQKGKIPKLDKIIIPGGESTTLSRLLHQTKLSEEIKVAAENKKPILGTCAGLIVLAKKGEDKINKTNQKLLEIMDIKVCRNAFGRQKESFEIDLNLSFLGEPFPSVFIRAPAIKEVGRNVDVLGTYNDEIVAAREKNLLVTAFHPELVNDDRVYKYFLEM